MMTQEQIELVKGWFKTIEDYARTSKTPDGYQMSQNDTLVEIAIKAKDAVDYMDHWNEFEKEN